LVELKDENISWFKNNFKRRKRIESGITHWYKRLIIFILFFVEGWWLLRALICFSYVFECLVRFWIVEYLVCYWMVENKTTFERYIKILVCCGHRKSVSDFNDWRWCLVRVELAVLVCKLLVQERNLFSTSF